MLDRTSGYKIIQFLAISGLIGNSLPPLHKEGKSIEWIWNLWWWMSLFNILMFMIPLLMCYYYETGYIDWFEEITLFSIGFKAFVYYIISRVHLEAIKVSFKLSFVKIAFVINQSNVQPA